MNARLVILAPSVAVLAACGAASVQPAPVKTLAVRKYNGTAAVGDFLSIAIDPNAKTITYTDRTNSETGTAPYTINADGTYAIADPNGVLLSGYEIPGYALVLDGAKTGPQKNTDSLITAVESGPISLSTFEGHRYNYMQFRTAAGGIEVGSVLVDSSGSGSTTTYWPYGAFNPGGASPFMQQTLPISNATEDPSGTFFNMSVGSQGTGTVFGTANGQFLIDTPNGAIIGLAQAASPAFDPSYAGAYTAVVYKKLAAQTGPGNVETGTGTVSTAAITVDASGNLSMTDGATTISGTLAPIANAAYLVGNGELTNPCPGLFTFRTTTSTTQQDTFVAFQGGKAILFGSFTGTFAQGGMQSSTYSYLYGTGIRP